MTDRKAYNSTLRPVSKKRAAEIKSGKRPKKPTPRHKPKGCTTVEKLLGEGKVFKASSLPKESKGERPTLIKELDSKFSWVVRLEASNPDGYLNCFICGDKLHWKAAENMHCEPRGNLSVRYDRINCQAGCHSCNSKPNGDRENFRTMLDAAFGPGTAERNEIKSKTVERVSVTYLRHLINACDTIIAHQRKVYPGKFEKR